VTIKSNGINPTKVRLKKRWDKDREKWKNNKEYQARQQERLEDLESHDGYKRNIEVGKANKGIKIVQVKKPIERKVNTVKS